MDLGHGAVDAPACAHLPPMQNEFLLNRAELHISIVSVISEITYYSPSCQLESSSDEETSSESTNHRPRSQASRKPSPRKFRARSVATRKPPGKTINHQ